MLSRLLILFYLTFPLLGLACSSKPIAGTDLKSGRWVTIDPKSSAQATVVVFLSAKCPCSESHEATLGELATEFKGFSFVGVHSNPDEDLQLSKAHFDRAKFSFPVIQDKDTQIADSFGALKTPHAFVISPKGECLYNGGVDDSKDSANAQTHYLKKALTEIQQGKTPTEKTTRTLGCIIQRS